MKKIDKNRKYLISPFSEFIGEKKVVLRLKLWKDSLYFERKVSFFSRYIVKY